MAPATSWTELSVAETGYVEGLYSSLPVNGFAIMNVTVPVVNGFQMVDPNVAWTELTGTATATTELTAPAVAWTELTL